MISFLILSPSYIEDVHHVWRECFCRLRPGGVFHTGMNNGLSYLFDNDEPLKIINKLPYSPLKDPEV